MDFLMDFRIAYYRTMIQVQVQDAFFLVKIPRRTHFLIRLVTCEALLFLFGFLCALYEDGTGARAGLLPFFVIFAFSFISIRCCFCVNVIEALYLATCGYAVQHMAYAVSDILIYSFSLELRQGIQEDLFNLTVHLAVGFAVWAVLKRMGGSGGEQREHDPRMVALSFIILFFAICLNLWAGLDLPGDSEELLFLRHVICRLYAVICCVFSLITELTVSRMNLIRRQNRLMDEMIHSIGDQQKLAKESIAIINRKCHDIKYQMKALKIMDDRQARSRQIAEIQKAVSIYDAVYHTGNEVLNLLLREKTLLCNEYDIHFSCIANGGILAFVAADDLYVLLGNALDNAIESARKEPDPEKRIISMNISEQTNLVHIHIENSVTGKVVFEDGLPVTTKEDKNYHGFGMKSIRYITDKYKGEMLIQSDADTFYLDILLPHPADE